jgi:hypothetical protein
MDANLILCDHAEAVNGKLYINGGGWNLLFAPGTPVNMSLAILIEVPWNEANTQHQLRADLLTADGEVVEIEGNKISVNGGFEVGRPPGIKPGTSLNTPIAMNINGVVLAAGGYEWRLFIDNKPVARRPFQVSAPPGMAGGFRGLPGLPGGPPI